VKILLDEDTPIQLLETVRHLLGRRHRVDHINTLGWQAKKDQPVFRDAAARGYQAVITVDKSQLEDPDEVDAIRKAGIHHIRFTQRHEGLRGLGLAMGAVMASIVMVVEELETSDGQRLVHIAGIDPTQRRRFTVQDPSKDPPKYWRR
jgi:hypothetical protein